MRIMLLILIVLWPAPTPPPTVGLYLVHAAGEAGDDWTPARAAAAHAAAEGALEWWERQTGDEWTLAPPVDLAVGDPFAVPSWLPGSGAGAIYVISRGPGDPLLAGGHAGRARVGLAVALETPEPGPLAALLAHEWGHAWYGLPDLDGDDAEIMARGYRTAYRAGWPGCRTLALMKRPCTHVHLPLIGGER